MSISQALGISEETLFKRIPENRIKHFRENDREMIETFPIKTTIYADNEEDRKILESVYNA